MEELKLAYKEVFDQQIWNFFRNDMESCFEVSKIVQSKEASPFKGGLNFTATLAIFSIIDFCAAFYHGREVRRPDIAIFMNKYFGQYSEVFDSVEKCENFYNVFRHGLSHQWSPKWAGIIMAFDTDKLILKDGIALILNAPELYKIVVAGFKDYEADLDSNRELRDKFHSRHTEIFKNDMVSARHLKEALGL